MAKKSATQKDLDLRNQHPERDVSPLESNPMYLPENGNYPPSPSGSYLKSHPLLAGALKVFAGCVVGYVSAEGGPEAGKVVASLVGSLF